MSLQTAVPVPEFPSTSLSSPVGALMRQTAMLGVEDSLDRAAHELRINGIGVVPIVNGLTVVGMVTEPSLALALAEGRAPTESVQAASTPAPTIKAYQTAADALRQLALGSLPALVVVDDSDRLMGLISASDLAPRRHIAPRPAMVGGMATPFGVYLTTGNVSAGASHLALMATGAVLFALLTVATLVGYYALLPLDHLGWPDWLLMSINAAVPLVLFMILMRLMPLAGTHAAEHQTVHAIERDEELVPEVVRRMPRVHPRCGTNLAAGAMIFLAIHQADWLGPEQLRLMIGGLATLYLWRPVGSWLQANVTTKPPSERQLLNGIAAGRELLDRHTRARTVAPSIAQRFIRSGLLQVIAGSVLMSLVFYGVSTLLRQSFGIDLPL